MGIKRREESRGERGHGEGGEGGQGGNGIDGIWEGQRGDAWAGD